MEKVLEFLRENGSGALATVDNGKPRVRPWGFMLEDGGRLYFCTNNTKNVYKQLMTNRCLEFTSVAKDMTTLRISGKAVFTDDMAIKIKVLASSPEVTAIYKSADNPIFEVFYIEEGKATFSDFTGKVLATTCF